MAPSPFTLQPHNSPSEKLGSFANRLLDEQNTAIVILNEDYSVHYLNPAAEIHLACSHHQACGQNFLDLVGHHPATKIALEDSFNEDHSYSLREVRWKLFPGKTATADITASPLQIGEHTGILLEIWPLDRKLRIGNEKQRVAIQDAAQAMTRGLAHEIKNPLGGIRGAAQLLTHQSDDPTIKEISDVIVAEADRLRALVERLNTPHKAQAAKDLNIHIVLERVATLISAEVGDNIELIRDYDPSIPDFPLHEDPLIQAILNLARNAMQSLQECHSKNPKIILRTRIMNSFTIGDVQHPIVCHISVEDNGPGIPDAILDSLFLPMVSGRPQGTGLGLSITQSIVHQHGGLLEFDNSPDGACFDIYLPMSDAKATGSLTPTNGAHL